MIAPLITAKIRLIYVHRVRATIMEPASRATDGFGASARSASMVPIAESTSTNVHLNRAWMDRLALMASVHFHVFVRQTNEENDVKFVSRIN